jgi:hypothetical protein
VRGVAPLPLFVAYFILNGAVFLCFFQPLLWIGALPVPVLEGIVVLVDALVIRLLAARGAFQGDRYRGVGWLSSLLASGIGNALSYLVGYLIRHWFLEMEL